MSEDSETTPEMVPNRCQCCFLNWEEETIKDTCDVCLYNHLMQPSPSRQYQRLKRMIEVVERTQLRDFPNIIKQMALFIPPPEEDV